MTEITDKILDDIMVFGYAPGAGTGIREVAQECKRLRADAILLRKNIEKQAKGMEWQGRCIRVHMQRQSEAEAARALAEHQLRLIRESRPMAQLVAGIRKFWRGEHAGT